MDASFPLSKSFAQLEKLLSQSTTSSYPARLATARELIQLWKLFRAEYELEVSELERLRRGAVKNDKIFHLKLLTSPTPYSSTTLFERRVFSKKELPAPSEVEILRNRGLSSGSESLSPSPPPSASSANSSGYGSPVSFPVVAGKRSSGEGELSTIRQIGNESRFGVFEPFPFSNQPFVSISVVELSLLEIDTELLFSSLRDHAGTIHRLKLDRVLFKGELNQRIEMPKLSQFYCHQHTNTLHKCENNNISSETFKSLLFFGTWEISDLLTLPFRRIDLLVDGWTQFSLNHESGQLISKLSFTNDILKKLGGRDTTFVLKKLGLQACKLDISPPLEFPNTVTYLNFQSILTTNLSIVEILRASNQLKELRFKNYIDTNGIYLKDIPSQHLKYLCLGLCTYTLSIKYSPGVTFPHLDTLVFPTNIMDVRILENLSTIFKTQKAVVYLCTSIKCNVYKTGYFILSQLLKIEGLCSIWMTNFRRIYTEGLDRKFYEEMEEFLCSTGLDNVKVSNFILLKRGTGVSKWTGREISPEEHQVREFQHRDGHKFSCWESYMKRY
jgi:hypothetical protein